MQMFFEASEEGLCFSTSCFDGVLLKAGPRPRCPRPRCPRPTAPDGPAARRPSGPRPAARGPLPATAPWPGGRRPGGPVLIFHSFFVQRYIHAHAQICIGFGRAIWTTVSLNSFSILIIIPILFDPFFPGRLPYSYKYGTYIAGKQCLRTRSPFAVGFL